MSKPVVLVVENDPDTQHLKKLILQGRYEVLLAADADDMRHHVSEHRDDIAAVLMDVSRGGRENGFVLARYLRQQPGFDDTPIIAVSAYELPQYRQQAVEAGCTAFLAKPFTRRELLQLLEELIAGRTKRAT